MNIVAKGVILFTPFVLGFNIVGVISTMCYRAMELATTKWGVAPFLSITSELCYLWHTGTSLLKTAYDLRRNYKSHNLTKGK